MIYSFNMQIKTNHATGVYYHNNLITIAHTTHVHKGYKMSVLVEIK